MDSGLLGWPLTVRISGATGFAWKFFWTGREDLTPQPVPAELDYDLWLGPAPYKPYHPHRVHSTFRGYWDYESGGLGDMGQHYIDPVQYLLGKDDDFPIKVEVDARWLQDYPRRRRLREHGEGPVHRRSEGEGVQGFRVHHPERDGSHQ